MSKYIELLKAGRCSSCRNINDTPGMSRCSKCRERDRQYRKADYEWYSAHGICVKCHQEDAIPGKTRCFECTAYYNNWQNLHKKPVSKDKKKAEYKARYERRKSEGLCTKCGRPRGRCKSTVMCNECYQKHLRSKYKRYWDSVGIPRKKRPEYGLCFICGKPYDPNGYKVCDKCREIERQAALLEDKTKWLEWQREETARIRGIRYKKGK